MQLTINGRPEAVPDALSMSGLLEVRGVKTPETVAVELNGEILDRSDFDCTSLKENDLVEFIYFMGGGTACWEEPDA